MNTETDNPLNTKLLQVICQLHDWENQHLHLVQSQAGRYLYLSLVKQLIQTNQHQPSALLKGNLQLMHNEAGGTMTFTVTDTGLGIACDVQDQLFTDLSALGAGFPAKDKTGTVLGLRLSHQLVQLMGGKLDYRTEAGVGSSFFFTLPMHSPAEQTA